MPLGSREKAGGLTLTELNPPKSRPAHRSAEDTFERAEAVYENAGPRVKRQHVVSRAVLGNFTTGKSHAPQVTMVDLLTGTARKVGTADAAIEKNFIRVDSLKTEQIWGLTETLIPSALEAARSERILTQPDQIQVLRRVVALHFARSISTRNVVEQTWPRIRDRVVQQLAERESSRISAELRPRLGRSPSREERLELVEHAAATGVDVLTGSGAYARIRIEQFYDQALERFESWGVEIIRAPSNDLVITDNPVVLARSGDDRRAARDRMAIDDAHSIVFPLAPDLLISMGPKTGYARANREAVATLNRSQIAGAHRFVFHRIGQDLSEVIMAHPGVVETEAMVVDRP
ncbi:DUF4238 domain-containing protein [Knoellia pratensis]|uniref:DUF4238 domain-containing protein n=1 Tax=Knoellia pratensis TaxID=3404796 RepID=UPI0036228BDC